MGNYWWSYTLNELNCLENKFLFGIQFQLYANTYEYRDFVKHIDK